MRKVLVIIALLAVGCTGADIDGWITGSDRPSNTVIDERDDTGVYWSDDDESGVCDCVVPSSVDADTGSHGVDTGLVDTGPVDTGLVDTGVEECIDRDSDGWCADEDCWDFQPLANPGMDEIFDPPDGIDNNCNGLVDEVPEDYDTLGIEPTLITDDLEIFYLGTATEAWHQSLWYCRDLGLRFLMFEEAKDLFAIGPPGIDPETGQPSEREGSCWCDWPAGVDPCASAYVSVPSPSHHPNADAGGVMRCDAFYPDLIEGDKYRPPWERLRLSNDKDAVAPIPLICVREVSDD